MRFWYAIAVAFVAATPCSARADIIPDDSKSCSWCERWNRHQEPFQIFGNTYYVGTAGLTAILVSTDDGLILLDGALPQSAPEIDGNIRALGFDTADISLILTSHAHFDHVGGVASLQRASDSIVVASPRSAEALRQGGPMPDDPQFAIAGNGFPALKKINVIRDGESLAVGNVRITAHFTPGHTPGGTSWSWRSCRDGECVDIVYADSLTPVSSDDFRFTGDSTHSSLVDSFRHSIDVVQNLPCDILLSPHPGFFDMRSKLDRMEKGDTDAFVNSSACREYALAANERLDGRVQSELSKPLKED